MLDYQGESPESRQDSGSQKNNFQTNARAMNEVEDEGAGRRRDAGVTFEETRIGFQRMALSTFRKKNNPAQA